MKIGNKSPIPFEEIKTKEEGRGEGSEQGEQCNTNYSYLYIFVVYRVISGSLESSDRMCSLCIWLHVSLKATVCAGFPSNIVKYFDWEVDKYNDDIKPHLSVSILSWWDHKV